MPDPSVTATAEAREAANIRESIVFTLAKIVTECGEVLGQVHTDRFGVESGERSTRCLIGRVNKLANQYSALLASVRRAETEGDVANNGAGRSNQ